MATETGQVFEQASKDLEQAKEMQKQARERRKQARDEIRQEAAEVKEKARAQRKEARRIEREMLRAAAKQAAATVRQQGRQAIDEVRAIPDKVRQGKARVGEVSDEVSDLLQEARQKTEEAREKTEAARDLRRDRVRNGGELTAGQREASLREERQLRKEARELRGEAGGIRGEAVDTVADQVRVAGGRVRDGIVDNAREVRDQVREIGGQIREGGEQASDLREQSREKRQEARDILAPARKRLLGRAGAKVREQVKRLRPDRAEKERPVISAPILSSEPPAVVRSDRRPESNAVSWNGSPTVGTRQSTDAVSSTDTPVSSRLERVGKKMREQVKRLRPARAVKERPVISAPIELTVAPSSVVRYNPRSESNSVSGNETGTVGHTAASTIRSMDGKTAAVGRQNAGTGSNRREMLSRIEMLETRLSAPPPYSSAPIERPVSTSRDSGVAWDALRARVTAGVQAELTMPPRSSGAMQSQLTPRSSGASFETAVSSPRETGNIDIGISIPRDARSIDTAGSMTHGTDTPATTVSNTSRFSTDTVDLPMAPTKVADRVAQIERGNLPERKRVRPGRGG